MSKEGESQCFFDFKMMVDALDAKFKQRISQAMESAHERMDQIENSQASSRSRHEITPIDESDY